MVSWCEDIHKVTYAHMLGSSKLLATKLSVGVGMAHCKLSKINDMLG